MVMESCSGRAIAPLRRGKLRGDPRGRRITKVSKAYALLLQEDGLNELSPYIFWEKQGFF